MQRRGKIEIDPLSFLSEAPRSAETANRLCKQSIAHVEPLRLQRRQVRRETYARTFRALLWSSSASPVVLQRSALRPQRPWSAPLWAAAAWYDILQRRARTAGTYACSFAVPRRPCLQPGKSGYPMDRQAVSQSGRYLDILRPPVEQMRPSEAAAPQGQSASPGPCASCWISFSFCGLSLD